MISSKIAKAVALATVGFSMFGPTVIMLHYMTDFSKKLEVHTRAVQDCRKDLVSLEKKQDSLVFKNLEHRYLNFIQIRDTHE
jgi:hypothetical protein